MRITYGPKTHVLCRGCGRKIFFTEEEVIERGAQRLLTLECAHETCSVHGQRILYAEAELEIYGFLEGMGSITGDVVSPASSLKEWGNLK
jgi:hypothetical protein